jgi:hypothetical protein
MRFRDGAALAMTGSRQGAIGVMSGRAADPAPMAMPLPMRSG